MLRVRTTLSGWTGGPGLTTHYFTATTEDAAAAARCRAYVHTYFTTLASLLTAAQARWDVQAEVDIITSADGHITDTFTDTTAYGASGDAGGGTAPPATAILLRHVTNTYVAGKRLRGRSFISPVGVVIFATDGSMATAAQTNTNAAGVTWLASFSSGDKLVVWHRPKKGMTDGYSGIVTALACQGKGSVLTSRRD